MIKHFAIAIAAAMALTALSATACPLEDAKKAEAEKKASTISQPVEPAKPAV